MSWENYECHAQLKKILQCITNYVYIVHWCLYTLDVDNTWIISQSSETYAKRRARTPWTCTGCPYYISNNKIHNAGFVYFGLDCSSLYIHAPHETTKESFKCLIR